MRIPVMIGQIEYFITSDNNQFMLSKEEYNKKKDTTQLVHCGYYPTLLGLMGHLLLKKIRASDAESLAQLQKDVRQAEKEVCNIWDAEVK